MDFVGCRNEIDIIQDCCFHLWHWGLVSRNISWSKWKVWQAVSTVDEAMCCQATYKTTWRMFCVNKRCTFWEGRQRRSPVMICHLDKRYSFRHDTHPQQMLGGSALGWKWAHWMRRNGSEHTSCQECNAIWKFETRAGYTVVKTHLFCLYSICFWKLMYPKICTPKFCMGEA